MQSGAGPAPHRVAQPPAEHAEGVCACVCVCVCIGLHAGCVCAWALACALLAPCTHQAFPAGPARPALSKCRLQGAQRGMCARTRAHVHENMPCWS